MRAYTQKVKEELERLEEESIFDFMQVNQDVGILFE